MIKNMPEKMWQSFMNFFLIFMFSAFVVACSSSTEPTQNDVPAANCINNLSGNSFTVQYWYKNQVKETVPLAQDYMKPLHWKDTVGTKVFATSGPNVCFTVVDSVLHHTAMDSIIAVVFEGNVP